MSALTVRGRTPHFAGKSAARNEVSYVGRRPHRRHGQTRQAPIGNVPARSQSIPRARARRELIEWMHQRGCTHALTLATNRTLSIERLRRMFRHFCLELDRICLGRKNVASSSPDQRLLAVAFVEHPDTNIHLHILMRMTGWWPDHALPDAAHQMRVIWDRIIGGAGSTMLVAHADRGWGVYATKDARVLDGDYFLSTDYHPQR